MDHLLLPAQDWWDAQRFDQPMWQVEAWRDQKVRHIPQQATGYQRGGFALKIRDFQASG
jgi:hypothetical protein